MNHPGIFLIYFHLFEQALIFLHLMNVKNVRLVFVAGIRTHSLLNMSLLQ